MQQDHQRREQPRHQADETVVMGKLTKAGAMLLADPIIATHRRRPTMKVLRALTRSLSGSAVLAGPAPAPRTGPVELTDMQLDQVAGSGVAGDRVNHQNSPIPIG